MIKDLFFLGRIGHFEPGILHRHSAIPDFQISHTLTFFSPGSKAPRDLGRCLTEQESARTRGSLLICLQAGLSSIEVAGLISVDLSTKFAAGLPVGNSHELYMMADINSMRLGVKPVARLCSISIESPVYFLG